MDVLVAILLLGVCGSLALENDVKSSAPEDLDGSGDDGDYSGSGSGFVETVPKEDFTTPVSPLGSTMTELSIVQHPDIFVKVETEEGTTKVPQTTKPQDAIDEVAAHSTQAGTTPGPTTQHTTAAEFIDLDVDKRHHHHHHHPHHHTTTQSTTVSDLDGILAGGEDHVPSENPTTSAPDDYEIEDPFQRVTTPLGDHVQPGVHHQETTSGSTSTPFVDPEEPDRDTDVFPVLLPAQTTTTVAGSSTEEVHRPGSHHEQTTSSIGGESNVHEKTSPKPTEENEPNEDLTVQEGPSTTSSSDENKHHHHHHHHHHHPHNHTTTPSATVSTDTDKPHIAHTQVPKGRNANVPMAKTTTAIPILIGDLEPADLSTSSTVQLTTSAISGLEETDDDSKEVIESSGDGTDFFIEATVPVIKASNNENKAVPNSDGSSDASHGIMERKELLAGIIAGGVAGLVFAAALVAFVLYRMKKKDEGSYSLEEPKQSNGGYQKPREQREFYA